MVGPSFTLALRRQRGAGNLIYLGTLPPEVVRNGIPQERDVQNQELIEAGLYEAEVRKHRGEDR